MSTSADLVNAIKKELKLAQMTYADLARALGLAESSVKRMLAKGDMPLSRVDAICRALKIDFAELARRVAEAQPLIAGLTEQQEKAVVADKKKCFWQRFACFRNGRWSKSPAATACQKPSASSTWRSWTESASSNSSH